MQKTMLSQSTVKQLREKYPAGTAICLIKMDDPHPVSPGTMGVVDFVDDGGNIWIKWTNGSTLPLRIEVDDFEVIHPTKVTVKWNNGPEITRVFARKSEAIVFAAEAKMTCKEKRWLPPVISYQDAEVGEVECI